MATNSKKTTSKPTTKNTSAKKETKKAEVKDSVISNSDLTSKKPEKTVEKKKLTLADVKLTDLVEVQSCAYGKLIYLSKKTGYKIIWNNFGESEYLTVEELLSMRNGQRKFFENQWLIIAGENADDVINFLQLEKYYKNISSLDDFDEIFNYSPDEISGILEKLSDGTKETVARRAYALVQSGELDSKKIIDVIENITGYEISKEEK